MGTPGDSPGHGPEVPLDRWLNEVAARLGVAGRVDVRAERDPLLALTRDVAHGVARPAAPLTAYLVGVAVGAGLPLPEAVRRVADLVAGHGTA